MAHCVKFRKKERDTDPHTQSWGGEGRQVGAGPSPVFFQLPWGVARDWAGVSLRG